MTTPTSNFQQELRYESDMPDAAPTLVQDEILGNKFSHIHDLGQGTYGKVIEARSHLTQQHVVIKFISIKGDLQKRVRQEIGLQRAAHENANVLRVLDVLEHSSEQFIGLVLELMPTDLHAVIAKRHGRMLEHTKIWCYFAQLIMALEHLHSMNILHRDIKAANCLISHNNCLKLADFGAAKPDGMYDSGRTYVGTPGYIAPEVRSGQPYGKEADLFSAGGVLFHLCTTREPQEDEELLADENQLPGEFRTLIMQLRHHEPGNRPSAGSLLHGAPGILRYRMGELRSEKDYFCEELRKSEVELMEKTEKIKELDNRNADLMQNVQLLDAVIEEDEKSMGKFLETLQVFEKELGEKAAKVETLERMVASLRVEVEDKEARIKLLERAAGPYVYRPLVFDQLQLQTFEDLDQGRAAW
ncbi:Serine/threonine-protein kinase Nek5, partial [Podila clonocystis]